MKGYSETGVRADILHRLISRVKWNWARTMPGIPHEYIMRDKGGLSYDEFYYILWCVAMKGVREHWGKYNFKYLYFEGYKYWGMGEYSEERIVINRQKVFNEFDYLDNPTEDYYPQEKVQDMADALKAFSNRPIFEFGVGTGRTMSELRPRPELYTCCDPSRKMVEKFRMLRRGFYRNICTRSFEESYDRWTKDNAVIVGLFGAPSYVMPRYLNMLDDWHKTYFLMFYKDGFIPAQFKDMHTFGMKRYEIASMFYRGKIVDYDNYVIATNADVVIRERSIRPKQLNLFDYK